jgi:hypothetical protein
MQNWREEGVRSQSETTGGSVLVDRDAVWQGESFEWNVMRSCQTLRRLGCGVVCRQQVEPPEPPQSGSVGVCFGF